MNILYLNSKKKWGGVVTLTVKTAQELQKRGHNVWIVSSSRSALSAHAPQDIQLVRRRSGMDFNPYFIAFIIRFIKTNSIELIVTNIKKEMIAGGMAARICGLTSVRLIGNEKDVDDSRLLQRLLVDKYIFPCRTTLELAQKKNPWLKEKDCRVIYNGVNLVEFDSEKVSDLRRRWGISQDGVIIGYTGRLVRSKGINTLIRAFAEVADKRPQAFLVLTGDGPHKSEFMELADKMNLAGRVIFTGFVTSPLLHAAAYDVGVLPSYKEAFPFAIVEYFAAGCPVVATRVGGVHEIITDGENGFTVPAQDATQLAERLLQMVDDPSLRERLRRGARKAIEEMFSQDRMIDGFERFYQECIQR